VNKNEAVWITGLGTANPLGLDYLTTARNLLEGVTGVVPVPPNFDLPEHLSRIAGRMPPIPVPEGFDAATFARRSELEQLLLWCCTQALRTANLWDGREAMRVGLALGLGSEWMSTWDHDRRQGGHRMGNPDQDSESALDIVQRELHIIGPSAVVAAACASGNYALAQARQWIRMGWADVCLAGAGDCFVRPMALACFGNLRALSRRNNDPRGASRPFDRDRDGFVVGEGGVVFVLESARHARRRGATPLAEIAGFGSSSDAFHMVIPSPEPGPAVAAMRQALADARVSPDEVDYVNAHATSTPTGDPAESRVLATVFGDAVRRVPVSSTKSMTGHLLSGAAAMNAFACLVALERGTVPPTINLHDPDPECALCHVPLHAREHQVRVAVSNSLGFGGSNTTLVLRKAG
jgi:3-oxoacyl-[acyl-carrier-protein] synthase II